MNSDMERTVTEVCNLSVSIFEEGKGVGRKTGFKEGFKEGRVEGHEEGLKEGRVEGHKDGFKDGCTETKKEDVINLAYEGFSPERISHLLKVSVRQVREWINS